MENQSKLDSFVNTGETLLVKSHEEVSQKGPSSDSIDVPTQQLEKATSPIDLGTLADIGDVDVTQTSLQDVLSKILAAVKPIAEINSKLSELKADIGSIKQDVAQNPN